MKKIITTVFILTVTTSLLAQSGRIRVYFAGFDCYRETWDDILQSDGKGDEVFFNFSFTLADKNGNSKLSYEKRTAVYGDATGQFSNRISAGTCVDLFGNKKGGIKAGDTYRCNDLIGEYDMADGDILTAIPTGWEQDPIADNSIAFISTIRGFYTSINQKVAPIMIGFNVLTGNVGGIVYNAAALGLSKIKAGGEQGELGKPGTRPIGMEKFGDFSPKLVVMNTPNLVTISNSNMGFGPGVIAVNYDEAAVGNLRDHGNYSILLRVEFIANQNTNTRATPPASGNNNTPPAANTSKTFSGVKNITMPSVATSITGTWVGTYGMGQNSSSSYYSFKLNTDGTLQMVAANNTVIANGTYTFLNNQLVGKYNYSNNGSLFSFAANLNGNQLSGTWGSNANVSGGGLWVMSKAALNATSNIR